MGGALVLERKGVHLPTGRPGGLRAPIPGEGELKCAERKEGSETPPATIEQSRGKNLGLTPRPWLFLE